MIAPNHLKSATEGEYDIGSGTFHQETVIDLREISDNEVEVCYAADTNLGGELAGFAEKIVSSMAKGLGERFAKNIRERLEGEGEIGVLDRFRLVRIATRRSDLFFDAGGSNFNEERGGIT